MKLGYSEVASTAACALAGATLVVALSHSGPAGPMGPAGPEGPTGRSGDPGHSATMGRLGVCWEQTQQATGITYVSSMDISSPILANGVYQCSTGETFVSVAPQSTTIP